MHTVLVLSALVTRIILAEFNGYIVGGEFAAISQFPFMASLFISTTKTQDRLFTCWRCGATILNQKILLTAAHCLKMEQYNSLDIVVSVGHENKMEGLNHEVTKYAVHENYVEQTTVNDIALLLLKTSLRFETNVGRAILMEHPPRITSAEVIGWGLTEDVPRTRTNFLKYAKQRVWSDKECRDLTLMSLDEAKHNDTKISVLCGGEQSHESDHAARGDSGGPLVVRGVIVIGVVSYAINNEPGVTVYTSTEFYYHWILSQAKQLICTD